jgi:aminoglycoside phosphotransferase (APT) family kinase protein
MREKWQRGEGELSLDAAEVGRLVREAIPSASVTAFRPASGGLSNTNIEVELAHAPHRVLLRLYQRDIGAAPREAALSALVRQQAVPTARFLHIGDRNGRPYAVLEWIEGSRLETVAPRLADEDLVSLGRSIGRLLVSIHKVAFERAGFLDAALEIAEPIDLSLEGLRGFLHRCLVEGVGGERLGSTLTAALLTHVEREGRRLDAWLGRPCLTHADFNGSNILVRRVGPAWEVAAVLDWEFAFSGSPAFDFGNLLRPPLGARREFTAALAAAYLDAGGWLPPDWRAIARLADLYAWADFLSRPTASPALIEDARRMIRETIDTV